MYDPCIRAFIKILFGFTLQMDTIKDPGAALLLFALLTVFVPAYFRVTKSAKSSTWLAVHWFRTH